MRGRASVAEGVGRLVGHCGQDGPLDARHPRALAQVSRTAKWLLNALASRRRARDATPEDTERHQVAAQPS
jgi:hypothetical protein